MYVYRLRVIVEAYCFEDGFSCHQVFSLFVFGREYVEDLFGRGKSSDFVFIFAADYLIKGRGWRQHQG
jgi:hypothetical protein